MVLPPTTIPQLSHGMVIRVGGNTIGAINEWNPRQTKTFTDLYEFGPATGPYFQSPGEPFAVVPGNVGGLQIDGRRFDLYTDQIEEAFGTPDITMLSNQLDEIQIREVWRTPADANNYSRLFQGVWVQDLGRTIDAKGDRTINVAATFRYTRCDRFPS